MKHPQIIPGRGGLPATSNVPWSAADESTQRALVLLDFIFMWLGIALAIIFSWVLRYGGIIPSLVLFGGWSSLCFIRLQRKRRKLYAMLLNKPRATDNLTQWTQHHWSGWDVEQRQFICECGRLVDLSVATFFKDSRRFACVCECGRGHFLADPKSFPFEVQR